MAIQPVGGTIPPAADVAYAASLRFLMAMASIQLSVTTAQVVDVEGQEPAVRVGTISCVHLDALSQLIEDEAARRTQGAEGR
jgi:hypothetical protein